MSLLGFETGHGREKRKRNAADDIAEESRVFHFFFLPVAAICPLPLSNRRPLPTPPPTRPLDITFSCCLDNSMGLFGSSSSSRGSALLLIFMASSLANFVSADFPSGFACAETKDGVTGSASRYISAKPGVKDKVQLSEKGRREKVEIDATRASSRRARASSRPRSAFFFPSFSQPPRSLEKTKKQKNRIDTPNRTPAPPSATPARTAPASPSVPTPLPDATTRSPAGRRRRSSRAPSAPAPSSPPRGPCRRTRSWRGSPRPGTARPRGRRRRRLRLLLALLELPRHRRSPLLLLLLRRRLRTPAPTPTPLLLPPRRKRLRPLPQTPTPRLLPPRRKRLRPLPPMPTPRRSPRCRPPSPRPSPAATLPATGRPPPRRGAPPSRRCLPSAAGTGPPPPAPPQ